MTEFAKDLDMAHVDHLREIADGDNDPERTFNFYTGQMGWVYLLKSNRDKATPEKMEAFFNRTHVEANFTPGPNIEIYTKKIIEEDPDPRLIEVAIRHGLYYKQVPFTGKNSLLHLAVENDRVAMARYLVEQHTELLPLRNKKGQTALDLAREMGKAQFVELLTKAQKSS